MNEKNGNEKKERKEDEITEITKITDHRSPPAVLDVGVVHVIMRDEMRVMSMREVTV